MQLKSNIEIIKGMELKIKKNNEGRSKSKSKMIACIEHKALFSSIFPQSTITRKKSRRF
jgi:hypothetical protein